jgi:hypothetical protein
MGYAVAQACGRKRGDRHHPHCFEHCPAHFLFQPAVVAGKPTMFVDKAVILSPNGIAVRRK